MRNNTKYIRFAPGSYQTLYNGICYRIDPENDIVERTYRQNFKYSQETKERALNLINTHGIKYVQKLANLAGALLLASILMMLSSIYSPEPQSEKAKELLFWGKFLALIAGLSFMPIFWDFNRTRNYYRDSKCEKCGKHLVFEEFQAPLMKETSKAHAYTRTLAKYWRCNNCGYEDIRTESYQTNHYKGEKQQFREKETCKKCQEEYALEEYRLPDEITWASSKETIRYFKCGYCGYHEIKIEEEIIPDY